MAQQVYVAGESIIETGRQPKENFGVGSLAAIPLATEGKPLGAIILGSSRRRAINENHAELLNTVAHQIALAIRNAQLYAQLGQMAILQERHRLLALKRFQENLRQR